jgi:hypothetical protein
MGLLVNKLKFGKSSIALTMIDRTCRMDFMKKIAGNAAVFYQRDGSI